MWRCIAVSPTIIPALSPPQVPRLSGPDGVSEFDAEQSAATAVTTAADIRPTTRLACAFQDTRHSAPALSSRTARARRASLGILLAAFRAGRPADPTARQG